MLQRLELIGFKSFADKTRFEFAPGVTAIVGPNGSGKSNVVDAVKWVLGEQSAKSLRGGEMTDVIFNGSSTRKSLGLAEVSLTFDNARRLLNLDADEVQIARRVYRDGQSEYLVNGQLARLKDIKDLFLGTGAGHGAYSVIEQGRVDALLTASTKDRRIIFEEAAGISRFKAKKIETLRKLERVDADLTRVRDILQELDKQLRALRLQASKAQRYQEYTAELRGLRVGLAAQEFRELTATLDRQSGVLAELRAEVAEATGASAAREGRIQQLERTLARTEAELRGHETELVGAEQTIGAQEATAKFERVQEANLESELRRLGAKQVDLARRQQSLEVQVQHAAAELAECELRTAGERTRAEDATRSLSEVQARIAALSRESQTDRQRQYEWIAKAAKLQGDTETLRNDTERLLRELNRKKAEAERIAQQHDALESVLVDLSRTDADVKQKLAGANENLAEHARVQGELRRKADALQHELESRREARSALGGRLEVLESLERSQEGFGAGVREVLLQLGAGSPALAGIVGLIADLLSVSPRAAPLVDLVLGDATQRFLVRNASDIDALAAALPGLPGRVGFVPLLRTPIAVHPLSLARAVVCESPELASLPQQLLGQVLLVDDLPTARNVAWDNPGYRVLTRVGELLEPDGTLGIGPPLSSTGLLSRKSELKELLAVLAEHERIIRDLESEQAAYRRRAESLEAPIHALETEIRALGGEAGTLRDQLRDQRRVQQQLAEMRDLIHQESGQLSREQSEVHAAFEQSRADWRRAEESAASIRQKLADAEQELAEAQRDRDRKQAEHVSVQVALSRAEEQLVAMRFRRDEWESDRAQHRRELAEAIAMDRDIAAKLGQGRLAILRAGAIAATAYADKEAAELMVRRSSRQRDDLRAERDALQTELKRYRDSWSVQRDRAHAHEMVVQDLTFRRNSVADRIRDDYQIELAESTTLANPDEPIPLAPADADAAQEQIDELKRKVAKLGSVNLEAVDELSGLEKRELDLRGQHDDLAESAGKLREIIGQIDRDSRKLFAETLGLVRGHFQDLFRKLFGGGMADIVLEDETNPLESGIEVTARPPGKELRNLSLLSGGERTLTAIALLLAIFRSRPSPFCILDEVDAALDEANTARLAHALREFLDRSQFIIITHKKRTMASADVLYGITMQESGVSKQVAVRFEDYAEEAAAA